MKHPAPIAALPLLPAGNAVALAEIPGKPAMTAGFVLP